ncbi:MAG: ABC transporter permease [Hyphomicrobiales bacterium]|nr:MAG: ABC transporter permease [Hyphomicrobiales bacterium]
MNFHAIRVIFQREMARFYRTIMESLISPVISTSLYFVVFGAAIGSRIETVEGVTYGAFIVPGLIMLTVITQSVSNASFAIHFPKFIGSIYELLSAPVSYLEIVIGYVGAAAVKSILIGLVILGTAYMFVDLPIAHPLAMFALLSVTSFSFSIFGFIIGIWAKDFQQLQLIPLLVLTPLIFLGGSFYSVDMLPGVWRTIALFNPVVYLMSVFRWSFFDTADVPIAISLAAIVMFTAICMGVVWWIFRTGWRIRQ